MQQVFDINKFKPWKGILRFPISLARIDNAQSAKMYFEDYIPHFSKKVLKPTLWIHFSYCDMLYMYDDRPATFLKDKYMTDTIKHYKWAYNYIHKSLHKSWDNVLNYYIPDAFTFTGRSNHYFNYAWDISSDINRLYSLYAEDQIFAWYINDDCNRSWKEIIKSQIFFFLEEYFITYLILTKNILLHNNYIGMPEWILVWYPWKPNKWLIYLMQQDFFKLWKSSNVYEMNRYDLTDKKLYDFSKIDLDTYDL